MGGPRVKRSAQRKPKRRRPLPKLVRVQANNHDWNAELINRLVLAALHVAASLPRGSRPTLRYVGSLAKLCTAAMQFSLNVLDTEGRIVHLPDAPMPN